MTRYELKYLFCAPFTLALLLQFIALAWLDKRLPKWAFSPLIAIFVVQDVAYNATVGWLLFGPPPREWFLTTRLKKQGVDMTTSRFIVTLNEIDPGHV